MKKVAVVLGVLAVLLAVIAAAGCVGDNGGNDGAAPAGSGSETSGSSGDVPSIAGNWQVTKCDAHDTEKNTEVIINADGTGQFTYYKKNVLPATNTLTWEVDKDDANKFHIVPQSSTKYFPTAYYTISADGNTLEGGSAVLTRV